MAQSAIDAIHGQHVPAQASEPLVVRWADAPGTRKREGRDSSRRRGGGGKSHHQEFLKRELSAACSALLREILARFHKLSNNLWNCA